AHVFGERNRFAQAVDDVARRTAAAVQSAADAPVGTVERDAGGVDVGVHRGAVIGIAEAETIEAGLGPQWIGRAEIRGNHLLTRKLASQRARARRLVRRIVVEVAV